MTIQNTTQLGAAVRAARKQLKATQKELAMTSGTGLRFLIDLERGKSTCQIGKILHVLQALGLRIALTATSAASPEGGAS
jgi:y4mF family transcriptional regulator